MNIVIDNIRLKYDAHHSLIKAHIRPGWFMRMLGAKNVQIMFIGHGTKWEHYPDYKAVNKRLADNLTSAEKRWSHMLRMNPRLNLEELAKAINKELNN